MKMLCVVCALVFLVGVSPAHAERASVVVAKATATATTAAIKAVPKAPRAAWHGFKWLIAHA